jgi:folate-binding protein YgfZ
MNARNDLSVIAFSGRDADTFLHNQLTQDIRALEPGEATFASICQPKGRVIALLMVIARDDGFRVVCSRSLADRLVTHLRRFVFRDQVVIEPATEAVAGPFEAGADAGDEFVMVDPLLALRYGLVSDTAEGDDPEAVARELEAGVAWLDEDTTEQFLPQMLGHEVIGALSFRKGCYPGQEIIARTRYLGKLKRHPWTGTVDEALPLEPLGECDLTGADASASAVLVKQARGADGRWRVMLVVRRPDAFEADRIGIEKNELPAAGRWPNDGLEENAAPER